MNYIIQRKKEFRNPRSVCCVLLEMSESLLSEAVGDNGLG